MMSNARCWRLRLADLVLATISLSGCATVGSDGRAVGTCPPVVDYSREFQARAAEELALLPEGSAIAEIAALLTRFAASLRPIFVKPCCPAFCGRTSESSGLN